MLEFLKDQSIIFIYLRYCKQKCVSGLLSENYIKDDEYDDDDHDIMQPHTIWTTIDLLHIPDLILKLYVLIPFYTELFPLTDKMIPVPARAVERTINLSRIFS